jgi:hypothetical protein
MINANPFTTNKRKIKTAIMKTTIRNSTAAMFIAASLQAHVQGTLAYALNRRSKQFMLWGAGMLLIGSI